MRLNLVGAVIRNFPWSTESAFKKGLERLGHEVVAVDPSRPDHPDLDMGADATLVFKDVVDDRIKAQLSKFERPRIVYQSDDMRFDWVKDEMRRAREFCDHAVVFESDGAAESVLGDVGGYETGTRIMLPVDDDFYRKLDSPKLIDVVFVGNVGSGPHHHSRFRMCDIVNQMAGVRFVCQTTFDPVRVNQLYNSAKVVLHHATDVGQPFGQGFGYQSRHFEAGHSGACVLSNWVSNEKHISGLCTFDSEDSLRSSIQNLLGGDWREWARNYSTEMHAFHRPEHRAQELVSYVKSIS